MNSSPASNPASPYDQAFYEHHSIGSRRSAHIVLDLVFNLIHPQSVVDIGCGNGQWLAAALTKGATDILGLDGNYVDRSQLAIPAHLFQPSDLTRPFSINRHFDLAMCLEVAEHLDFIYSEHIVKQLTSLAPAILFSAAIPGQGGTDHRNEQWPTFWCKHFLSHGFTCYDFIRPSIWHDGRVEPWYRQNTLLFLAEDHPLQRDERLAFARTSRPLDAMHPDVLAVVLKHATLRAEAVDRQSIKEATSQLLRAIRRRIRRMASQ